MGHGELEEKKNGILRCLPQDLIDMVSALDDWPCFAPELDELRALHSHFPDFTLT